jgi:lactoylglutathione lyase
MLKGAMSVRGLFETHLTVADLPRSVAFFRDVVGLPVALEVPERAAVFHWIGRPGRAMLGLWRSARHRSACNCRSPLNVALVTCSPLRSACVLRESSRSRFFGEPADEPSVIGWMPATAMYFRDPDGHMLEYLTMLERPPRPELGVVDWSQRPSDPSSKPPPGPPNPTPSITPIWLLVAKSQECAAIC